VSGELDGRRALVTGGTRGIGAAIAQRLRDESAEVTVTGTSPGGAAPAGCAYRAVDFADREAATAFAAELTGWELDVLVNNAGINRIAPFAQIEPRDFDEVQEVNVRAPMLLCRAAVEGMRRRGWGRIVNVSSVFGKLSRSERAAYSASKFALDGLTAALAAEVAADGVLANCVAPGFIETDLTRSILGEDGMAELADAVPARRLGTPAEVAELVLWLAGPRNTYVSGQNVVIDGGFTRV
jgi:NAD(P)-dependent dehydrogenase (short-subunit alcohol dehydrogenase family)